MENAMKFDFFISGDFFVKRLRDAVQRPLSLRQLPQSLQQEALGRMPLGSLLYHALIGEQELSN